MEFGFDEGSEWRRTFVKDRWLKHPWTWEEKLAGRSGIITKDLYNLNIECVGNRSVRDSALIEFRPFVREELPMPNGKDFWDVEIDKKPLDWDLRAIYADWLEDKDFMWLANSQRYLRSQPQIANLLTPGPACVMESVWHEATWFDIQCANMSWSFFGGSHPRVKREWCLPTKLFEKLRGYILDRRDGGSHNKHAKSWNSRREAEIGLALALRELDNG